MKTRQISKIRWSCAIVGLLFGLVTLPISIWAYNHQVSTEDNYKSAIVIDAGSSHTSFSLFQWTHERNIQEAIKCERDCSLNDFANNLDELEQCLKPCLDQLQNNIIINQGKFHQIISILFEKLM